MSMKNAWAMLPAATLLLCPIAVEAKSLTDALSTGKASMNTRLRYENVDDTWFSDEAEGMTLRTRLGYETSPFYKFTAMVEFEDTHAIGGMDRYQLPPPPTPVRANEAVIADPEQTELNRIQLRYRGVSKLDLILGRQRLMLDNQRWIGAVGFRQNEQTFDAFTAVYTGISDWTFNYSFVDRVYGITDVFDANVNDALFNVAYNGFTLGKITAYSYLLSNQEDNFASLNGGLNYFSNDTLGLRLDGFYMLPTTVPLRAFYRAEYAKQDVKRLAGAAKVENTMHYNLAELGMGYTFGGGAYTLIPMVGYEVLGSDGGNYGLQTPYATKHAFQGWADQFLVTPAEGLVDTYVSLGFDLNAYGTKFVAMYHDYKSDEDRPATRKEVDFGSEWNVQAIKTIGANWTVGTKAGRYSDGSAATGNRVDATKLWAWVEFNF